MKFFDITPNGIFYKNQLLPLTEDTTKLIFKDITKIDTLQHTTFKQLSFDSNLQPDAFFSTNDFCIVAELKKPNITSGEYDKAIEQLKKYIEVSKTKFNKVIGILWDLKQPTTIIHLDSNENWSNSLPIMDKDDYKKLIYKQPIQTNVIFNNVAEINNILHFFHLENFKQRAILTACVLIAQKHYNIINEENKNIVTLNDVLYKTAQCFVLLQNKYENLKEAISILQDNFSSINLDYQNKNDEDSTLTSLYSKPVLDSFSKFNNAILNIANEINKEDWNGNDVMMLFFNEFNRYNNKRDYGQVFTPQHIADLMINLIEISANDHILDGTCGSGSFLISSFNYLKSVGEWKYDSKTVQNVQNHLYGIELDKQVFSLAVANCLLHEDYYLHLKNQDVLLSNKTITQWQINKVVMNPPYENKYKPLEIIKTILDNTMAASTCAFLLPNDKLTTNNHKNILKQILQNHTLNAIIRLPEDIFSKQANAGRVSIFIFESFKPQNNKDVFSFSINDDGFVSIKNKDRIDVHHTWNSKKLYWLNVYRTKQDDKYKTAKWIKINKDFSNLKYEEDKEIKIELTDFYRTLIENEIFKNEEFKDKFKNWNVESLIDLIKILKNKEKESNNKILDDDFKLVSLSSLFEILAPKTKGLTKEKLKDEKVGKIDNTFNLLPFVSRSKLNNGISAYTLKLDAKYLLNEGNVLTVGSDTSTVFLQTKPFYNGNNISILKNDKLLKDEDIALFLVSIIRTYCEQSFYWGANGATRQRLNNLNIKLPMKKDNLDVDFIKKLTNELKQDLKLLIDLKW